MFKQQKKGQVTIFILTGLIFMIAIGVGVVLLSEDKVDDESVILETQESVFEARPVQQYISACLEQTLQQGIEAVARNGGYLNPIHDFDISLQPTESEMIVRGPNHLPYWFYFDEESGTFSSNAPPLRRADGTNSIEEQLENYIKQELPLCFDQFERYKDRLYVQVTDINPLVIITASEVSVQATIPTNIVSRTTGNRHSLDRFFVSIPTQLEKIYNLAKDVTLTQQNVGFLERPIVELLHIYSGVGRPLPPIYEVEMFSPGAGETWLRDVAHQFIIDSILPRVSIIQILYTRSFEIPEPSPLGTPSILETATQGILEPSDDYYDLDIRFSYPRNMNPSILIGDGDSVLRGDSGDQDAAGFFTRMFSSVIRKYRFNYQMSYPVISRICDTTSFNGKGLCFYFSLEGNIRDNEAFLPSTPLYGLFGSSTGDVPYLEFDDPGQYVDKIVEFSVVDTETFEPLDGVQVYYDCGDETPVGQVFVEDGEALFSGKMPYCGAGGRIILRKPGYYPEVRRWNNREGESYARLLRFELAPLHELSVSILKRGEFSFGGEELEEDDTVIVSINRIKEDSREDDFPYIPIFMGGDGNVGQGQEFSGTMLSLLQQSQDLVSPDLAGYAAEELIESQLELGDLDFETVESQTVHLVPGEYEVSVTYILSGNPALHIPSEHKRICTNGEKDDGQFCLIELDEYTLPEVNMQSWLVSDVSYNLTIDDSLYGASEIIFYAADVATPRNYDEFEEYTGEISNMNRFGAEWQ
jgi:hypothetical protein